MKRVIIKLSVRMFWLLLGLVGAFVVIAYLRVPSMPELQEWHREEVVAEISPELDDLDVSDFTTYRAHEEKIFKQLAKINFDNYQTEAQWSRFHPSGEMNPASYDINWNKSYEMPVGNAKGGVLLIHGLTDSPYSLRTLAVSLHKQGYYVVGLRLPGHGTLPGALAVTDWEDFRAAVSFSSKHLLDNIDVNAPLIMVGYSTGAVLSVDYSLSALNNEKLKTPDLLVMLSPAMRVSPVAGFAKYMRWMSKLPGLERLAWTSIASEYDPYKYNSFSVYAAEQMHLLTARVQNKLIQTKANNGLQEFPPILVFQSVVDATVPAFSIVDNLLSHLPENDSELVLFDVNRSKSLVQLLNLGFDDQLEKLKNNNELNFSLTLLSGDDDGQLYSKTRKAKQQEWVKQLMSFKWPDGVYSLSHVALPFAANDPLYGSGGIDDISLLHLGRFQPRGERGVFGVSMDNLMRLRYNPFYSYVEEKTVQTVNGL